jgi:hypothetical protein
MEILMLSLFKSFNKFIHGIEHDYPLTLAQKGICLNLDNYFLVEF